MTAEEFLRWEESQPEKHEFVDGRIREMGAVEVWPDMTVEHGIVMGRLEALLAEHERATTELMVEVLTPQNADFTYSTEFSRHRRQPSVKEIFLIDLAHRRADVYQRCGAQGSQWMLHAFELGETVVFASIPLRINLNDLFAHLGPAPVPQYRSADSAP